MVATLKLNPQTLVVLETFSPISHLFLIKEQRDIDYVLVWTEIQSLSDAEPMHTTEGVI